MEDGFEGKVVAVTGGGGGFGRRFVQEFRARGAHVYCCDISEDHLGEVRALGATAATVDLRDRQQASAWVASIEAVTEGRIDILVNNAGGTMGMPRNMIENVLDSEWDEVISANVDSTFAVSRAAVPGMKRAGKGRIINISSGAGIAASRTNLHPYTVAKHAIVGLTRQMAAELGQFGITVNSVAPGLVISSPSTQREWARLSPEAKQSHLDKTFMRRVGEVADIANAVLFLASDRTSWISGQIISVDGGIR